MPADDAEQVKAWSRDVARALDAIALPVEPEVIGARAPRDAEMVELLPGAGRGAPPSARPRPPERARRGGGGGGPPDGARAPGDVRPPLRRRPRDDREPRSATGSSRSSGIRRSGGGSRRTRALLPGAIEELLRYDGPGPADGPDGGGGRRDRRRADPGGHARPRPPRARRTATPRSSPSPTGSTSGGTSRAIWRSAPGSTTASAPRSPGWKPRSRSGPCCDVFRH